MIHSTLGKNGQHNGNHNGTGPAGNGTLATRRLALRPARSLAGREKPTRRTGPIDDEIDAGPESSSPWSAALRGALVISVALFAWMAWSQPSTTPPGRSQGVASASCALRISPGDGNYFRGEAAEDASTGLIPAARALALSEGSQPPRPADAVVQTASATAQPAGNDPSATANKGAPSFAADNATTRDGTEGEHHLDRSSSRKNAGIARRTSVTIRQEPVKAPRPKAPVVVEQPRITYQPKPVYPPAALVTGREQEGSVHVKMLVSPTGTVSKLEILEANPPGVFDDSVKEVLPQWRFIPAKDDSGKPVEFWKQYTYVFKLQVGT